MDGESTKYDLKLFSFAITWWVLWLTRNKMRMERKFPNQPCDVLFSILSKMQRWGILLRASERESFEEIREKLGAWVGNFNKNLSPVEEL